MRKTKKNESYALLKNYELVINDKNIVIKIQAAIILELLNNPSAEYRAEIKKKYKQKKDAKILEIHIKESQKREDGRMNL